MSKEQIALWLNQKYEPLIIDLKKEIIDIEGGYVGHLGDYVAEAIANYLDQMRNFPEKIGKEQRKLSNLAKIKQKVNGFVEFFGDSLTPIRNDGLDYTTFEVYLKKYFKLSDRQLRDYKKDIFTETQWSVIKIPDSKKKIVLHRQANLYELVERFDITLNNYYSGLRPNKTEQVVFNQIKQKLMPKKVSLGEPIQKDSAIDFLDNLEVEE